MARPKAQLAELKGLIDRADRLAKVAKREWRKTILAIRKEVAFMTDELDVGKNAANREKVIRQVEYHITRLRKRLERLERSHMEYVSLTSHERTAKNSGIKVEYSKERADALMAAVRARAGGGMAATLTQSMSRNAVTALRQAVVLAFQENAVAGGTLKDLSKSIKDRWQAAAKTEANFKFTDKSGREWDTDRYVQMNVRANTMRLYNQQTIDDILRDSDTDLVRVSDDGRTEDSCKACKKWAGRILSATGRDKDFPTLEEAEADGLFHPNCIHTLDAVDSEWDEDEIARQREENAGAKKAAKRKRKEAQK